ncbi:hypothetical protein [Occultella kanbiaonis]|uniref:hypothetical protein n=1 Tax=Occultella kanbiaonis TaxID=2675754 RepID=UPI0012B9C138|nr:hypothetical protein [Occultella kanbiaonis]
MMRYRSAALAAILALAASAVTALGATAAPLPAEPAPAATGQVVVGDFEPGSPDWDVYTTGAASGAITLATEAPASGAGHGRIEASVPTGTFELARWPGQIEATALELQVRTADVDLVTLRLQDSTGQAHQQRVAVEPDAEGWQTLRLEDFTSGDGYLHFGGADDGVWHGPLRAFSVILDTWSFREGSTAGTLDIDAVVAEVDVVTAPLALQTLARGNVFHTGDDVAVAFTGDDVVELSWTVRDAHGTVVDQGAAPAADLEGTLPFGVTDPGWYTADVVGTTADGTRYLVGTDLAVLEPLPADFVRDPRFGVATHYGQSWPLETAALVADAGFGLARDEAYWAGQETTPGQIVWQDKVVAYQDEFEDLGLGHFRVLSYGNPLYFPDEAPTTPEGREAFARYAVATVAELGVEGNYFEVWNEWNWRDLDGPAAGSASQYVALLQVVHDAVKAEYPDAVLVGPALAPMNDWQDWFSEFADLGGLELIDAVSTHPYTHPNAPEGSSRFQGQYGALRTIMGEHGHADMPLLLSEVGWPTAETAVGVDEATQARLMVRGQLTAFADGAQNFTIYDFMDDGTDAGEVEHRFGIVRNTDDPRGAWVPKPAYVTSAVMNRMLAGLPFESSGDLGDDAWDVVFSDGNRTVHAAWATVPTTAAFAATGPVTVTDAYGGAVELAPDSDGLVHVSLDEEPIYVEGAVTAASVSDAYRFDIEPEVAGTPATGHVVVDRTGRAGIELELEPVGGDSASASVGAGQSATVDVAYLPQSSGAERTYSVLARVDGVAVALLRTTGSPTPALSITGVHGVDSDGQVLRLQVTNATPTAITLDGVDVAVGDERTRLGDGESVPATGTVVLSVPIAPTEPTDWTATVLTITGTPATASGTLTPLGEPVAVPAVGVDVDGVADPAVLELAAQEVGVEEAPALPGWEGPADSSASIWLTHDDENLYLTLRAQDDVHAQPSTGGDIWQGDSVQIGLVAGAPGEDPVPQEIGVALTDAGEVVVHRWAPADVAGTPAGVTAAVVRDEGAATTTYEVAISWAEIGIDPAGRLLASTVVLNENDGSGREGWLSWGLGLAETKNVSLFNALVLAVTDEPLPPVTLRISVRPQCWGAEAVIAVHVVNTSEVPLDIRMTTDYGSHKLTGTAPGAAGYHGFTSGAGAVDAGSVTVAAYAWNDGQPVYERFTVAYEAVTCA